MDELRDNVLAWSRRARLQRSVGLVFFGLACGLGLALLVVLASRVVPLMDTSVLIALSVTLAFIGLIVAVAYPWLRHMRTQLIQWARTFDQRFGLQERISTALEINDGDLAIKSDLLRNVQRQDANRTADAFDTKRLLPLKLSRRDGIVSVVFLLALLVAIALPNPQQQILAEREQLRETIAQQIQQLDQAQQAIEQSRLTDAQKELALEALNEARQKLEDPNVTPEEALAAINEAQSKLDALNDQAARQQAEDLRQAGESLSPDELTNSLANSLANNDFQQAAEQMRSLTNSSENGQPLSEEELQRAANQMDQLARGVQNSDPALANQLREAAQNMREGNAEAAQQQLDQAAQSLERAQQTSAASQSLDNAQARAEAARQAIAQQASRSQNGNPNQANQANANANAGAESNSQSESNQPGQPGQAGQASAPGEGEPGSQSASSSAASGAQNNQNESRKSDDFGSDDSVYAPQRVNGDGRQVVLPDSQSQNAPNPNGRASTAPGGNTTVPYEDVYGDYSKAADEAMQSGQVPADMRDYVRDYFSSLDPNQQNR